MKQRKSKILTAQQEDSWDSSGVLFVPDFALLEIILYDSRRKTKYKWCRTFLERSWVDRA